MGHGTAAIDCGPRRETADRRTTLAERGLRARDWRPETIDRDIAWDLGYRDWRRARLLPPAVAGPCAACSAIVCAARRSSRCVPAT
ncbi:hypothetical protein [Amycolatopsis rubida]|uniref:hypothetical protein n=1 Tax=Amycolatopsis rubida TaxID=112413 RepID=UPI00142F39CD|nr:hypothetical protein [Amycolatopsis rubida]